MIDLFNESDQLGTLIGIEKGAERLDLSLQGIDQVLLKILLAEFRKSRRYATPTTYPSKHFWQQGRSTT
jgi:hypothetical protein